MFAPESALPARRALVALVVALVVVTPTVAPTPVRAAPSPDVVISQVYGGGGNSGAFYANDFIELYNRGGTTVDLTGWSVQYAAAGGTTWNATALDGQIPPGRYYLVQQAAGTGGGTPLPDPDATGSTNVGSTQGKVALVTTASPLTCGADCDAATGVRDFVGYGAANDFETAPTRNTTNSSAAIRNGGGSIDTDNNSADFTIDAPTPRNCGSACSVTLSLSINDVSANETNAGTTTFSFLVSLSAPAAGGGASFDIATADNTATVGDNDYVASSLAGQTIPEGSSTYQFDVIVNGDTGIEANESFFVNVTNVTGATVADGQGQGTIQNDDSNPCDDPFTPIFQIQGSGSTAALTGMRTTEGVVVGDFEGTAANSGFFIQDPVGDGDAATSDGIFVFTGSSNTVDAGDYVRVTGFARERFTRPPSTGPTATRSPVTDIIDCGAGSVAETDVTMPFAESTAGVPYLERFEGMKVRFPQSLVIAEYFNYGRFGEMVLALPLDGETRPFTGTAIDEPGAPANARTLANSLRRITLDDNQSAQNPPVLRHPNGQDFSLSNKFRGGDHVQNTVGVLGFDFNLYRIFPTGPADYSATNERPTAPEPVGGTLRVAAMNTLNFFLTLDTTANDTGGGPLRGQCQP